MFNTKEGSLAKKLSKKNSQPWFCQKDKPAFSRPAHKKPEKQEVKPKWFVRKAAQVFQYSIHCFSGSTTRGKRGQEDLRHPIFLFKLNSFPYYITIGNIPEQPPGQGDQKVEVAL